jgi:DNA-binding response OmpR family regulator
VVSPAPDVTESGALPTPLGGAPIGVQERAVLDVLLASQGRVISRRELARRAGLADLSERRCDSVLVGLRRQLGKDAIVTVRSRGWMLDPAMADRAAALLRS